jgi:hypothetical protein
MEEARALWVSGRRAGLPEAARRPQERAIHSRTCGLTARYRGRNPSARERSAMGSRETNGDDRSRELDPEAARYRQAAVYTLAQLEWVVGYLHKIRKSELARAIDRNRKQILERIP